MVLKSGLGFHNMWGFSPSIDLLLDGEDQKVEGDQSKNTTRNNKKSIKNCDDIKDGESKTTNILLVQPSDPRHIIHTLARRHRKSNSNDKINIYILEVQPEILARHVFLLHVFFDNIQIRQRASLFLEVFGNTLVQEKTEKYVENVAPMLRDLINRDDRYTGTLNFLLDFDAMKQRERDEIDSVFKSWGEDSIFDVVSLRDHRLRGSYADRYDCRQNLIDWDYFTSVKKAASIIHIKQFQEWRMTGVAFEFGNAVYCKPNRTMSSFFKGQARQGKDYGLIKEYKGFWLDILIGPYISFGVEIDPNSNSNAENLFQVVNAGTGAEQHRHHTVDVAMYNMLGYMWEMETCSKYEMKRDGDVFSGLGGLVPGKQEKEQEDTSRAEQPSNVDDGIEVCSVEKMNTSSAGQKKEQGRKYSGRAIDGVKIIPLKGDLVSLKKKKKYKHLFNQIHLSQQIAHLVGEKYLQDLIMSGDNDGTVPNFISVESTKYLFALNEKEKKAIQSKITHLASSADLVMMKPNSTINSNITEQSNVIKFRMP